MYEHTIMTTLTLVALVKQTVKLLIHICACVFELDKRVKARTSSKTIRLNCCDHQKSTCDPAAFKMTALETGTRSTTTQSAVVF